MQIQLATTIVNATDCIRLLLQQRSGSLLLGIQWSPSLSYDSTTEILWRSRPPRGAPRAWPGGEAEAACAPLRSPAGSHRSTRSEQISRVSSKSWRPVSCSRHRFRHREPNDHPIVFVTDKAAAGKCRSLLRWVIASRHDAALKSSALTAARLSRWRMQAAVIRLSPAPTAERNRQTAQPPMPGGGYPRWEGLQHRD
jgi:hypothetical protein